MTQIRIFEINIQVLGDAKVVVGSMCQCNTNYLK